MLSLHITVASLYSYCDRNLNEKMEDIMNIVKSLEDSGLLIKGVKTIVKTRSLDLGRQKIRKTHELLKAIKGTIRAGQNF